MSTSDRPFASARPPAAGEHRGPTSPAPQPATFPRLRWVALAWLAVWLPAYARVWGWQNFFHLCDIAVVLTAIGLWRGDALLLSSQAVSSILGDFAWCLDAGWRLVGGRHLVGGTEYMWDARFPLWVRLLSLFHVFLPVLLVCALRRTGYDRRGWLLQSALTAAVLPISRFLNPALNVNFAFHDPVFHRHWDFGLAPGPAAMAHLAVILTGFVALLYWPMHRLLARLLPNAPRRK